MYQKGYGNTRSANIRDKGCARSDLQRKPNQTITPRPGLG